MFDVALRNEQDLRPDDQSVLVDQYEDVLAQYFDDALLIENGLEHHPLQDYLDEVIADEEELQMRRLRFMDARITRRLLRDYSNAFQMDPESFRKLYRLWSEPARILVELLRAPLAVNRHTKIPTHLQVLITLLFLAEGGFQKGVGQDYNHPVSQSRVSYIMNRVIQAILTLQDDWIKFPSDRASRLRAQAEFLTVIRISGILAAIDGFLIRLKRPREFPEAYWNYKDGSAVNVLLVCRFPGSNNDQNNWLYSELRDVMLGMKANAQITEDEGECRLLADSGYAASTVLLTLVENAPDDSPEAAYTAEHARARMPNFELTVGRENGAEDDLEYDDLELVMDEALYEGLAERQFLIDLMYT
ncbi:hypothetical protein QAD02_005738 [Eretmocerus hayati]|uniref:Uncharacterized protein n=1 Tax=Eretmocerus hayati TaxID=131215 RepID=A0ACC2NUG0_9HYME|nr:hypothetical protein QAD02_005738 [Eretmocerus hayati]